MKLLPLLTFAAVILCVRAASNICRTREPCSVTYKTIGCYRDDINNRALPHYIYNERDSTISNYGNRKIEWHNWNNYVAEFSCRCAQKAKEQGYDLFGVQFYGECWAGKKGTDNHAKHDTSDKCLGDDYKTCGSLDRYCSGEQETNFVYEIVDTTCPGIEFEEVGCYKDSHNSNARPLANYILTDRDSSVSVSSGISIDWRSYDAYLPDFACRCAKKAQENGATHFGLQFYGECWAHPNGAATFGIDGPKSDCIDGCYRKCGGKKFCIGPNFRNYVYRIKSSGEGACHIPLESVGCYTENPNSRALGTLVKNIIPGSEVFYGQRWTKGAWNEFFPDFLCACAEAAKGKGLQYFGVSDYGECYGGGSGYNTHGASSACREGPSASSACSSGSMLCSGPNPNAMYVYKVSSSSKKRSFQSPPLPDNIQRKRANLKDVLNF